MNRSIVRAPPALCAWSLARRALPGLSLLAAACAPVIKDFDFPPPHPLQGKRIGIVYSRSGAPGSEGVDDRDRGEFLGALAVALRKHARNAVFADFTDHAGVYPRVALPDTGWLGRAANGYYAMPDSASLKGLPDSLDCLLLISGLSFTGGTPVEDTLGAGVRAALVMGTGVLLSARPGAVGGAVSLSPAAIYENGNAGDATEGTAFRYLVWDLRKRALIAYHPIKMTQSRKFGSETTTFAQDGARMGQLLLRKLAGSRGSIRAPVDSAKAGSP